MCIGFGLELSVVSCGVAQLLMLLREEALSVLWKEIAFASLDNRLRVEPSFFEQLCVGVGPTLLADELGRSEYFIARCLLGRSFAAARRSWA